MKNDLIFHIKTGGTIGGCVPEYIEIEKIANIFLDSIDFKKHITQTFKIPNEYAEIEVCWKDSRDINSGDRDEMLSAIQRQYKEGVRKFLVTHGTYTMPDTAKYLMENLSQETLESSLVILTGSMYPWPVYGSDAPLNLGASLSNLIQQEVSGVFICMHGRRFDPNGITKDSENLIFKTIK